MKVSTVHMNTHQFLCCILSQDSPLKHQVGNCTTFQIRSEESPEVLRKELAVGRWPPLVNHVKQSRWQQVSEARLSQSNKKNIKEISVSQSVSQWSGNLKRRCLPSFSGWREERPEGMDYFCLHCLLTDRTEDKWEKWSRKVSGWIPCYTVWGIRLSSLYTLCTLLKKNPWHLHF